MKNENLITPDSPSALKAYLIASRPKTWIASLSPVLIGTVLAPQINLFICLRTLLFSLFIQIGTNFANDYFDFIKGADTDLRTGPKRATQQGWISPSAMFKTTLFVFATALIIAIPLMLQAGLWSLLLATSCVAFGILYTGGPKPLGYLGLGEIFVFIFFGPVATCGAFFLQTGAITLPVFIASLAPGLLSCSILIANNLRDETSDRIAKKNTLIVRFGRKFGSWEYTFAILIASIIPFILILFFSAPPFLFFASLIFFISLPSIRKTFSFHHPLELISVLQNSALCLFIYTLIFCVGYNRWNEYLW